MVFSLRSLGAACLSLTFAATLALSQSTAPTTVTLPLRPLLPQSFAGWTETGAVQKGDDAGIADASNTDVLKEYGIKDYATAEYDRGSNHLTVHAKRFVDATGAYGAFTFYRRPGMRDEALGKRGAADSNGVLFWTGTTLVDVAFEKPGSISAADKAALKDLAAAVPQTIGPEGIPPSLPHYLPAKGLNPDSVRYAIGPLAYARMSGVLPPSLVDFSRDAEAVTAQYFFQDGSGTLTVLEYPTPQMAVERAKAIDAALKQGIVAGINPAASGAHRSGPLVAVTSGNFSGKQAQVLLDNVKYEAAVTWNHPEGYVSEVKKTANLLLGIAYLIGILGGAAILLGLFLGGGRALFRVLRGKPVSTMNEDDFISLKLRD